MIVPQSLIDSIFELEGWLFAFTLYAVILLLSIIVPTFHIVGYVKTRANKNLRYELNGFRMLLITYVIFFGVWYQFGLELAAYPYKHFISSAACAVFMGLSISAVFYIKGPWDGHVTAPKRKRQPPSFIWDFFFGFELNPRIGWFDIKMWLYLIGALVLQINVLSGVAAHMLQYGTISYAMLGYAICFTWFIVDYLWHEHIHVTTYDIIDENVGMKLIWGCFAFYPYFYPIGIHSLVYCDQAQNQGTMIQAILAALVFLSGWVIARGANNQKYQFKTNRRKKDYLFGLIEQKTIAGKILVSGFWGYARHFQYFGEILMGIGLALPGVLCGSGSWLPLLYPLYYILILVPREMDDGRICQRKYGSSWLTYKQRVPYRIIPFIW